MSKKYNCPGKEFYNEVIQSCIEKRKNPNYLSKDAKKQSIEYGHFLEKTATQIEISMEYAFFATTKEEQETEVFKKVMKAMNSYRQGIYYKGSFLASSSGCIDK